MTKAEIQSRLEVLTKLLADELIAITPASMTEI
jgi:hypothetical protein